MKINRREATKLIGTATAGAIIESQLPPFAITVPIGREGRTYYHHLIPDETMIRHEQRHREQIKVRTNRLGTIRGDIQFAVDYVASPCQMEVEAGDIKGLIIERDHPMCRLDRFLSRFLGRQ